MLSTYFSLFIVALQASASARHLPDSIPRALQERAPRAQGGWAYASLVCPTNLDQCGSSWCCPTSLTCVSTPVLDNLCCPGSLDCTKAFETNPYCADDTWSLWDQTTGGINNHGYFCCQPGEVGLMTGFCIASNTIVDGEVTALALLPGGLPISSGAVTVSSTVTTSIPASTSAVTTTVITTTAITASGSSAAVVTSTSSVAAVSSSAPTSTSSILVTSSTALSVTSASVTPASVTPSSTSTLPPPVKTSGADSLKNSGSLWTVLTGLSLTYVFVF